ncbi:hypothetical protein FHX80_113286 [Streptomyces brevispora]|uniref:Uncharacterized protein n=1 Tax=Streptomyces brevispora TaxID=887462 RepID=A0A561UZQ0_9ACTN|nr:hypothetical protein FHX80_113286 [Streptomyces brevispora]
MVVLPLLTEASTGEVPLVKPGHPDSVRKRHLPRRPADPGWFAAVGNYPGSVSTTSSGAGDRLVRIGAIVFFVGALCTLATMAPLFLGTHPLPSIAWALCMLMGVGFLIAAAGVVRSARAGAPKQ